MKFINSTNRTKVFITLVIISYALCLGSVASFIAMNVTAGKNPSLEYIYWQRIFVSSIMTYATIPGTWMLLIWTFIWYFATRKNYKKTCLAIVIIVALIFINGQFILRPIVKTVNNLAAKQIKLKTLFADYTTQKKTEDILGAVNLLLLLTFLIIFIICILKTNDFKAASR